MSEKRKSKSLEEVERELAYFGLTRRTAAAIVRLANNLKQTRKLRAAHIELLTPGRRLHPPSPLGQIVWNQSEIEIVGKIESSNRHDNQPEPASCNETFSSEATTVCLPLNQNPALPDMNALGDLVLSRIESVTLTDIAPIVDSLSISQDPPLLRRIPRQMFLLQKLKKTMTATIQTIRDGGDGVSIGKKKERIYGLVFGIFTEFSYGSDRAWSPHGVEDLCIRQTCLLVLLAFAMPTLP
ncbi:hypothetical protein TrVFT333_006237 [Trichoderma virens FT-333]|nr:hypothetical protein TrVFT333_006237 [Trichoderma virens FT-333]